MRLFFPSSFAVFVGESAKILFALSAEYPSYTTEFFFLFFCGYRPIPNHYEYVQLPANMHIYNLFFNHSEFFFKSCFVFINFALKSINNKLVLLYAKNN